jgi:hypothetical protein
MPNPLRRSLALVAFAALASCSTPGAKPTDMTTTGHEAAATGHAAEAAEHAAQYDADATATKRVLLGVGDVSCPTAPTGAGAAARCYSTEQYNPTAHHLASAERHQKMAKDHAKASDALVSYEDGACKLFDASVRASCPLLGQLEKVERLPNGVRLVPKAGVNVAAWQAHIACHVAFAQAKGAEGMPMCPLGVRGVRAATAGDAVELTSDNADDAARLFTLAQSHGD